MNVVLIGYRGSGKSSVGKLLAQRLGRTLISTDEEVVRLAKLSIQEIVGRYGWDHFRELESQVCRALADKDHLVIDTGGGAILRPENVRHLKSNGRLVWLTAEVRTIVSRIQSGSDRPSLTGTKSFTEEVSDVLKAREMQYAAAAHHVISTEGRTVEQVAEAVLAQVGKAPNG
jgi:shikimate kinase